jgi:hypothetical protein
MKEEHMFATVAVTILLAAAPGATNQQGATRQQQMSTSSGTVCAKCAAHHASAARSGWGATRRDNPHSTVVEDESAVAARSPTNEEINAAETGNPDSVDFRYANVDTRGTGDLEALEVENPHNAQPGKRVALAAASPAVNCGCMVSDARRPPAGGQK